MGTMKSTLQTPEQRLTAAGLTLPRPLTTTNLFRPTIREGALLYVSGHVPKDGEQFIHRGRLGADISTESAKPITAAVALSCLASIKAELGDLSKVKRILKVVGFFASTPEFAEHSVLLNAGSEVFLVAFGEAGMHARSAIGVVSLPHGAAIELEMVVAVHE